MEQTRSKLHQVQARIEPFFLNATLKEISRIEVIVYQLTSEQEKLCLSKLRITKNYGKEKLQEIKSVRFCFHSIVLTKSLALVLFCRVRVSVKNNHLSDNIDPMLENVIA